MIACAEIMNKFILLSSVYKLYIKKLFILEMNILNDTLELQ